MAKHCYSFAPAVKHGAVSGCELASHSYSGYGCRVIQRLIEYCASVQISALLDEVLQCCILDED